MVRVRCVCGRCRDTHEVIWVSMKMRMKTRRAGRRLPNIIQMGNCPLEPSGFTTQPRLSGLVTENPLGTLNFYTGAGGRGEITEELASFAQ